MKRGDLIKATDQHGGVITGTFQYRYEIEFHNTNTIVVKTSNGNEIQISEREFKIEVVKQCGI